MGTFLIVALVIVGVVCAYLLWDAWRSPLMKGFPAPTRPEPSIGVQPTSPWPCPSLQERWVQRAIDALERPMLHEAEVKDALDSAEYFINKAREAGAANLTGDE